MSGCTCASTSACGCCDGLTRPTPVLHHNRPGLSTVRFRVGTHGQFKQSLLAGLTTGTGTGSVDAAALRALTTRDDSDFTIALLDSWAVVLDVLSFYQERIANEDLLRTALERRSILELARLIGYAPHPGAAAATHLSFDLDASPGSPARIVIPAGTRVQSQPGQDELPLTFETDADLPARPEWSRLPARRSEPQHFNGTIDVLYLQGPDSQLQPGDRLILESALTEPVEVRDVRSVQKIVDGAPQTYTRVDVASIDGGIPRLVPVWLPGGVYPPLSSEELQQFSPESVRELILGRSRWPAEELHALVEERGWDLQEVAQHLEALPAPADGSFESLRVYALRRRAAAFGHNALKWSSLPAAQKFGEWARDGNNAPVFLPGAYTSNWDGRKLHTDSQNNALLAGQLHLDAPYARLVAGGRVLLESSVAGETARVYSVDAIDEVTRADYGMSAKVSRLQLDPAAGLDAFTLRDTSVYAESEPLPLARRPLLAWIGGAELPLDTLAIGLLPGRRVVVRGRRLDLGGVEASETRVLAEVEHRLDEGTTVLTFDEPLAYRYERESVSVNANVVLADHGETQREVLGGGDAARPYQSFTLRQKPVTQVSAETPSGVEPALEVRVGGVRWYRRQHVLAPDPSGDGRTYILERDDDGSTHVHFGGARRLPTGQANVSARYRTGLGVAGNLEADRLQMLVDRPLGVTGVTNPLPASGGADPETLARARGNAPGTVLTLDRVVSLRDFEDFASAFGGIAKARADHVWDGRRRVVYVTVAGEAGAEVTPGLPLYDKLRAAIDRYREPFQPMLLASYAPRLFHLAARLLPHPDHLPEDVLAAAQAALAENFSFERRRLGEVVAASDVVSVLQAVPGMLAVDLDHLYLHGEPALLQPRLVALPARRDSSLDPSIHGGIAAAELLTLAPGGADLSTVSRLQEVAS